jgi:hypothetical protein
MSKTIDLIYSSRDISKDKKSISFFETINGMKQTIRDFKKGDADIYSFDDKSVREIARGNSYAVFPELKTKREKNPDYEITLDDIRTSLEKRGINDKNLQDKVLVFLLQNKLALHFGIGSAIHTFTMQSGASFSLDPGNLSVKLEAKAGKPVKMLIEFSLQEFDDDLQPKEALKVHAEIDITSDKTSLNKVQIKQVSNSEETKMVFKFLQNNQSTLWEKIKICFNNFTSKFLGTKTDPNLELENDNGMECRR